MVGGILDRWGVLSLYFVFGIQCLGDDILS